MKQKAGFICFSNGMFSQAEALFKESECDPREVQKKIIVQVTLDFVELLFCFQVIVLYDRLLPSASTFRPKFNHGVPPVETLGMRECECVCMCVCVCVCECVYVCIPQNVHFHYSKVYFRTIIEVNPMIDTTQK